MKKIFNPGNKSVWECVEDGDLDEITFHIENGLDLNAKKSFFNRKSLIERAADKEHWPIVAYLLERGAATTPSILFKMKMAPLYTFCRIGSFEAVKMLLNDNADIEEKNNYNWTPLHVASLNGHSEVVKLLLDKKADIEAKQKDEGTPLHLASQNGHLEVVKLLLDKKADIEAKTNLGHTPLHLASEKGHSEVVKLLQLQFKMSIPNF